MKDAKQSFSIFYQILELLFGINYSFEKLCFHLLLQELQLECVEGQEFQMFRLEWGSEERIQLGKRLNLRKKTALLSSNSLVPHQDGSMFNDV